MVRWRNLLSARSAACALVGLVSLVGTSCLSPTLPLPPPEQPDTIHAQSTSTWLVSGSCQPGAIVSVFDETSGVGVIVEDRARTGHYVVSLQAARCDVAWITEEIDNQTSTETVFVVQERKAGDTTDGPCQ
jgi:hypothetical protein